MYLTTLHPDRNQKRANDLHAALQELKELNSTCPNTKKQRRLELIKLFNSEEKRRKVKAKERDLKRENEELNRVRLTDIKMEMEYIKETFAQY